MKRKAKASKFSKNGGASKGSRNKRRKTETQIIRNENTENDSSKHQHSKAEKDSVGKVTRSSKKKLPHVELPSNGRVSTKNAAKEKSNKNDSRKSIDRRNSSKAISISSNTNQSEIAKKNGGKANSSSRRQSKPPPSDAVQSRRRSSRRSGGSDDTLVSLSYNYPKGMEWDSFGNCWVKKGIATSEGTVAIAHDPKAESPSSNSGKKKEPEKSEAVEIKDEVEHQKQPEDEESVMHKDESTDTKSNIVPSPPQETEMMTEDVEQEDPSAPEEDEKEIEEIQKESTSSAPYEPEKEIEEPEKASPPASASEAIENDDKEFEKESALAEKNNEGERKEIEQESSAEKKNIDVEDQFDDADEKEEDMEKMPSTSENNDDGDQFADPEETEPVVEVQEDTEPNSAEQKSNENGDFGASEHHAPSAVSGDIQPKESQETIVVNPEDVNVNDFCFVCRLDGNLMECFAELEDGQEIGCGKSIHIGCIGRLQIPSGDWLCTQCARRQGLQINPNKHPQYGHAFGEDDFEVRSGGSLHRLSIGSRIAIFWKDDNQYYNGTVMAHAGENKVEVIYDDGVRESLDMSEEKMKILMDDRQLSDTSGEEERKISLLHRNDIVCGRGDSQTNWARQHGYLEFRKVLQMHHSKYVSTPLASDRRALCKQVYAMLQRMGLRFVSWNGREWIPLANGKSVDKVNQGLRDFRAGSVEDNEVDNRGLRWKDIPLGYSTKKGLAYRPGYQILRKVLTSVMVEYNAAEDKRPVCEKVLHELEKEGVRIVRIVKKDTGDDWVRVQKDKAITRIMRAFREESGNIAPVTNFRSNGIMPSQQVPLPPQVVPPRHNVSTQRKSVSTERTYDSTPKVARPKARPRNRKSLPNSKSIEVDNRHPLLRVDPSCFRVSVEVDSAFMVQSDSDADSSSSSDDSSESSLDSAMNQVDLFDGDLEQASIKPSLVDLCSKIRVGHLCREDRPASQHFEPATKHESANYYYQPKPLQRKPKLSYQRDMICDLIYSGPGKSTGQPAAHLSGYSFSAKTSATTPRLGSKFTKKRKAITPPSASKSTKVVKPSQPTTKFVPYYHGNRPKAYPHLQTSRANTTAKPLRPTTKVVPFYHGNRPKAYPHLQTSPTVATKPSQPSPLPATAAANPKISTPTLSTIATAKNGGSHVQRQPIVPRLPAAGIPTTSTIMNSPQRAAAWNKLKVVPHHLDLAAPKRKSPTKTSAASPASASSSGKQDVSNGNNHGNEPHGVRFRNYQVEVWTTRLHEAQEFRRKHGHCVIPHDYPENQELARWAKRQRYQYQLWKNNSGKSYMTKERVQVLEQLGFCWEHKSSVWFKRYAELCQFIQEHGHTLVPTGYLPNRKLATWVKCQRRQMRLRENGEAHSMTDERVELLNKVKFAWQVNLSDPATRAANNKLKQHTANGGEDEPDVVEEIEEEEDEDDDDGGGGDDDDDESDDGEIVKWAREAGSPTGQIPGLVAGLNDTEIGEEERRIRAKYKGGSSSESIEENVTMTLKRKRAKHQTKSTSGIGEEERKIRAKYGIKSIDTVAWSKTKSTTKTTTTTATNGEIGEEERKIRAKYYGQNNTSSISSGEEDIGEEERKIRAKYKKQE